MSVSVPGQSRAAVMLVLSAVALFAVFDTTIKLLSQLAPLVMVLWARYLFQMASTLLGSWPRRGRALLHTGKPGLQALRGFALLSMSALAFLSLQVMPVGEFTAIIMLTPLLITLLATLMLGEQVSVWRWGLLLGGLAGALLVIRPHGEDFDASALLPLTLVVMGAAFQILTGRLARTEDPTTTHFYTGLVGVLLMSLLLPFHWQALPWQTWAWMVVAGALSSSGHFLLILAYMRAKAATLTPYLYFQIAFATLAGWLAFGHVPDQLSLLGIAGIGFCGALGTWLTLRESRRDEAREVAREVTRELDREGPPSLI